MNADCHDFNLGFIYINCLKVLNKLINGGKITSMFGFLKFGRKSLLGGEIYHEQRRKRIMITIIAASVAFALLNFILYSFIEI